MLNVARTHKFVRGARVAALILSLAPMPAQAAGGAPLAERPAPRRAVGPSSAYAPAPQPTAKPAPDTAPGLQAVEIVATKRDALQTAVDADGVAAPGDTVRYTIVIRNQGGDAAEGVTLTDTIDANTTLSGVVKTTSLARPDAYSATGNTTLTVDAASGLLSNDADPDGSGALIISAYDAASAQGGQVAVNTTTGAFTYNPPVGYEGTDAFSYTIRDVDGNTDTTTVTLTVTEMVWYINNTAGAGGDGRYATPFNSLAAFSTAQTRSAANDPEAGDIIFIYQGSGAYTNGITLKPNQQLIGQGENLVVNGQTIVTAAGDPIITNTTTANGGDGIVLATGNTVRGLTVGNTNDAGIWGSSVGTATVSNVVINGTGKILAISGGTLAMTFDSLATSSASGPAINLNDLTNTSTLTSNSTTLSGVAGDGIILQDSAGATLNLGAVSISLDGAGDGIEAVTDVSGASLICASLAITTTSGRGIAAGNGLSISVGGLSSTINAVGGAAIEANNSTINGVFSSVSSSGGNCGLSLTYHTGTLTMNGGAISGASLQGVYVSGGSGAITYAGSVTATAGRAVEIGNRPGGAVTLSGALSDTAQGISAMNNSGGTITFSGATKTINTGANTAVSLTSNTGATISFTNGGLDIDTTSGAGINATGGGTLVISGENNTINTTTGTSVNIANTTIGAGGVTLSSVSANGAANGIVLNNTGSNAFTITGDGSLARNGSGGVIQNTTGDGVSLTSAQNVTLRAMNLVNNGGDAIESSSSANIALSAVTVQNPTRNGWLATNLTGSSNRIDNNSLLTQINCANTSAVYVANTDVILGSLTFNNSTFSNQSSANGQGYVVLSGMGTAVMTLNVENICQFTGLYGSAIIANAGNNSNSTAVINLSIADSDFINAAANGLGNIEMMALQSGAVNFDISNNALDNIGIPLGAVGVINIQAMDSGKLNGTVDYNAISNVTGYIGIRVNSTMTAGPHNVTIDHNTLTSIGREGVYVYCFDNTTDMDVWVTNNTIGTAVAPVGATAREGIEVRSGDVSGYSGPSQLDIVIQNNQVVNNAASDQTLDLDCEDGGVLNAMVAGNTLQNLAGGGLVMTADTEQAGCNMCLNLDGNTAVGGDGSFTLTEYSGSTFTVYNLATVASRNTGTVSVGAGIAESGVVCSQPLAMMLAARPTAMDSVVVELASEEPMIDLAPEGVAPRLER